MQPKFYTHKHASEASHNLDVETLGGKGKGLMDMAALGVPVPEFVVIPTTLCVEYMSNPAKVEKDLKEIVKSIAAFFEADLGFLPLLSVRSGARVSMPGMMDTILNVGIGTKMTKSATYLMDKRTKLDCERRFLHMYASTVYSVPDSVFEEALSRLKKDIDVYHDTDLNEKALGVLVNDYKEIYAKYGITVPKKAIYQIYASVLAVMQSWDSPRAVEYRNAHNIPHDWGTAVVIQRMVFGNYEKSSGSGVLFTRDPKTGDDGIVAEYLPNAQGEDVVAGIRTPEKLALVKGSVLEQQNAGTGDGWRGYLGYLCHKLEQHYLDVLDIEFTVEKGQLYILQSRVAKRSARAWVRTAIDMYEEGLIDKETARSRIKRQHISALFKPVISPLFKGKPDVIGIPASAGVVTGKAVFTSDEAKASEEPCILIRKETSPEDIGGMLAAVGVVTATGGETSHAAVVARGMDKPCIVGCTDLQVSEVVAATSEKDIELGTIITMDGETGRVWIGEAVPTISPTKSALLKDLWGFTFGDDEPKRKTLACPGHPGDVYSAWQIYTGVAPDPVSDTVHIILDAVGSDPVLGCMGDFEIGGVVRKVHEWVLSHGVEAVLYPDSSFIEGDLSELDSITIIPVDGLTLGSALLQPVTVSQLETLMSGSLSEINALISPATVDEKFMVVDSQRHRLLSAYE